MFAFLAGLDVLALGTIVGALLLSGLFIWFALDDGVIDEGVERRRREALEAPPHPRDAAEAVRRPSTTPLGVPAIPPAELDDPRRPGRAA